MSTRVKLDSDDGFPLLQLPDSFLFRLCQDYLEATESHALMQCSTACAKLAVVTHTSQPTLNISTHEVKHWEALRCLLRKLPRTEIFVHVDGRKDNSRGSVTEAGSVVNSCDLLFGAYGIPAQPASPNPYTCVALLHLKGLHLSSLLPDNIAAMCPNLNWYQLTDCSIQSGPSASNRLNTEAARCVYLESMQLHNVATSNWVTSMGDNPEEQASRITQMFPSLVRVDLDGCSSPQSFLSALSSQLINLIMQKTDPGDMTTMLIVISTMTRLSYLAIDELRPLVESGVEDDSSILEINGLDWITPLQYLGKLHIPNTIVNADGLKHLLSLPWLTELMLYTFELRDDEDFSQHPCIWRQLSMQSDVISLRTLGLLPLRTVDQGFWASPAANVQEADANNDRQKLTLILPGGPDAVQTLEKSQTNLYHCPSVIPCVFEWRVSSLQLEFDDECTAEEQAAVLAKFDLFPKLASVTLQLSLISVFITPQTLAALFDEKKTMYAAAVVLLNLMDCPAGYTDAATWQLLAGVHDISICDQDEYMALTDYLSLVRLLAQFKKKDERFPRNKTTVTSIVELEQMTDTALAQVIDKVPVPDHVYIKVKDVGRAPNETSVGLCVAIKTKDANEIREESPYD